MNTTKIIEAAKIGGEVIMKYFGQSLETTQKSSVADFRTKADLESENAILNILTSEFPEWNIISEENGEVNNGSEYTIVIDPLDGTNNFSLGIPNFTVSIAVIKSQEVIFGLVYLPVMKLLYFAEKGKGSFLDQHKLRVNGESSLSNSSISIVSGYTGGYDFSSEITKSLNDQNAKRTLTNWSPAFDFCLLASGKIEGIIHNNFELYDYAAGKLIATEAGAIISSFKNEAVSDKEGKFIASNGTTLHSNLVQIVENL